MHQYACSIKKTFFNVFLDIMKRTLQNISTILKKCFLVLSSGWTFLSEFTRLQRVKSFTYNQTDNSIVIWFQYTTKYHGKCIIYQGILSCRYININLNAILMLICTLYLYVFAFLLYCLLIYFARNIIFEKYIHDF